MTAPVRSLLESRKVNNRKLQPLTPKSIDYRFRNKARQQSGDGLSFVDRIMQETENFNNDGRLGGSKRGALGEQSPTDVLKQAQEMTAKTRERLSRIGVRDIYGEEANEDSDEANEGANLEEDNLQLLGQGDQRKQMSKEEMLYFKEKKKNQYLNTLLKNLTASLKKLDKEYGDDKMEKMTRALARKKQTQVQEREKKISSEIMNSMNQVKSLEQQTKTADKELAGLRKKYEKVMDRAYLR